MSLSSFQFPSLSSTGARLRSLVYHAAFLLALAGVLGFVSSVPRVQEQARAEHFAEVLLAFEPVKLVSAPASYLAEAEHLLPLFSEAHSALTAATLSQERREAVERFRLLLEEGLVHAMASAAEPTLTAQSEELERARDTLVALTRAAGPANYWPLLFSTLAVFAGLLLLLFGVDRHRRLGC